MPKHEQYTLAVGEEDKKRLTALNIICNPYTLNFFESSKIDLTGKHIIDLGCGIGIMTAEWATRAGPSGKVTAIDISEEQIAIAKKYVDDMGIKNVEFICCEAGEIDKLKFKADLIYVRFLLEHLHHQEALLKKIYSAIENNGYLFCETITSYDAMFSSQESKAFDLWKRAILMQPKLHDTNFYFGKQLPKIYKQLGLDLKKIEIQQPMLKPGETRKHFLSGLEGKAIQEKYIRKGFFTLEEISSISKNIMALAREDILITFPQYIQIIGEKRHNAPD